MKILLMGTAREGSTRVKNKLTRSFGNTTLFDLYLKKFEEVKKMKSPFDDIIIAINKKDKTLWEKSKNSDVKIVERDEYSASSKADTFKQIFHFLEDFDQEWVVWVNACFPFLKPKTIVEVVNVFKTKKDAMSLTCVRPRYNHFWDFKTHMTINNQKKITTTQRMNPVLENVSHVQVWNRDYIFEHDHKWGMTKNHPYLHIVKKNEECLDINTELDFSICESLWRTKYESS